MEFINEKIINEKVTNIVFGLFMIAVFSQIIACGGGGGGGESGTSQPTSVVPEPPPPVLQTKDLVAPDNFDYETSSEVTVDIKLPELSGRRAFVSLFSQYARHENNQWRPDFGSRLMMEKLREGEINRSIKLTHDIDKVLVQIWTDNKNDPPYSKEITVDNATLFWRQ